MFIYSRGWLNVYRYNTELLNLADYTKKDVIRYLLDNYHNLRRWSETGDAVALDILIDLETCLDHEYLPERERITLKDFYIKQYNLYELASDYHLTPEGIRLRVNGGVHKIYELLNNRCEYKLYGKGRKNENNT